MLRRFWLLFAQACTLCLAALFVVATLRPDLLPRWSTRGGNNVVVLQEAVPGTANSGVPAPSPASYAEAARRAMPAVVNVYTSKAVRSRNLGVDESLLKRYFPEFGERSQP